MSFSRQLRATPSVRYFPIVEHVRESIWSCSLGTPARVFHNNSTSYLQDCREDRRHLSPQVTPDKLEKLKHLLEAGFYWVEGIAVCDLGIYGRFIKRDHRLLGVVDEKSVLEIF